MRVFYSSQRNKLEYSEKKSGSSINELIKIRWPYYEKASILNDYLQPHQTFRDLSLKNLDQSSPASITSLENAPVWRPAKRKMQNAKKKNVPVEETTENKFQEVATEYMEKLAGGPIEKDDYFSWSQNLSTMVDG